MAPSRDPGVPGQCLCIPLYLSEIKAAGSIVDAVVSSFTPCLGRRLRYIPNVRKMKLPHNFCLLNNPMFLTPSVMDSGGI